jgi:tetratricopeptide (TPR) repeat protein
MLPATGPRLTRRDWQIAAALAVCTAVTFLRALDGGFINFDDPYYVTKNPNVTAGLTLDGARWALTTTTPFYWHPLTWLSLQLDASLSWPSPRGFLLTNVLLHAANAALLFLALHALTGAPWRSAAVALLFAVHPLRVESVAWVTERKDVLSCFFGFFCLWAYAAYARQPSMLRYALVALTFGLSLMAKPMLVTLPFLLLVLDWWPLGRWSTRGAARLIAEKLPLLAMVAGLLLLMIRTQQIEGQMRGLEGLTLAGRLANAAVSYVIYPLKMIWPANLAVYYPHPLHEYNSGTGLPSWKVVAAALALTAVTTAAFLLRRRMPSLLTGWLWYLGTLLPVIGLLQSGSQAYADRFTYFPQIGLLLAVVWAVPDLSGAPARVAAGSVLLAALALAIATQAQLSVWSDPVRLWQHSLRVTGPNPTALVNLADQLAARRQINAAVGCYRDAIRVDPACVDAHVNLGNLLHEFGRFDEAEQEYEAALRLDPPGRDGILCNLGAVEAARGNMPRAIERFHQALEADAHSSQAHVYLGNVFSGQGKLDEAAAEYEQATRLKPEDALPHVGLASVFLAQKRLDRAAEESELATRLDPGFFEAHRCLGLVEAARGNWERATNSLREALRLRPDAPAVRRELGTLLLRQGRREEALPYLRDTAPGPPRPGAPARQPG